jgi:hypothetical protein
LDQLVLLALQVLQAIPVLLGLLDQQGQLDQSVLQAQLDHRVFQVYLQDKVELVLLDQ